ncbi:MAG: thermonuclease family protein [Deltaproteobacteria bacterium]|nr:thermonuclease family protein [Deltaproteobacteria bacterium]
MARKEMVTRVIDGDTFITDSRKNSVRLANINAPEKGSPGAAAATRALRDLIQGDEIIIDTVARDKYGRSVANVKIGNRSVNAAMKRKGYK